jgi:hypothetical protein
MFRLAITLIALSTALLSGCDMIGGALGIESPEKVAAAREADGKAIGGACRHAGRAIEDCYALNKRADKSSVFAGWRDMNDYMRENNIESVAPQLTAQVANLVSKDAGPKAAVDSNEVKPTAGEKPATDRAAATDKAKASEGKARTRETAKAHDS